MRYTALSINLWLSVGHLDQTAQRNTARKTQLCPLSTSPSFSLLTAQPLLHPDMAAGVPLISPVSPHHLYISFSSSKTINKHLTAELHTVKPASCSMWFRKLHMAKREVVWAERERKRQDTVQ